MYHKKGQISASMMCADLVHLDKLMQIFEAEGIDYLHIDVMDGNFVPNYGLGIDYIRGLRELTSIPLDFHLMIDRPEEKLAWFDFQPTDCVSIHYESTVHVQRTVQELKGYGCKIMLAINPATPIYSIEEVLEYIDGVNVLLVNPGFAGQKIVHSCIKKVEKIRNYLDEVGYEDMSIEVDGNVTCERAKYFRGLGVDIFVAGTSSIFSDGFCSVQDNIAHLKKEINDSNDSVPAM